jgi:adenylate kinase family enzyme
MQTGIEPEFILFFDCPEEEMEKRILSRNQGREDDNLETIRKRFKVFLDSTVPVVNHYETTGKVRKVLLPPTSISLSYTCFSHELALYNCTQVY